ncbi:MULTISPECIES: ABC transporter permease subunit [unclassified Paenibacillus]|uniref:ABC transporter permease subunit n=1 Tax=unclassified Paenibacillus TaxID=185978 RepID=UPI000955C9E8|nr:MULTISPECIES: ABC transporter permease subunit [unclassified Paenibacillus]ASS68094.1 ABC transporter permease subunit [Paenibacillus sp. RUD330]SIR39225.1 ABC-type transport system involved in multi-copper enzyme maturation, permease component [Paenibacillus sp. RU4X]SIR49691.1 ABC-type transport system involved in multi-copper enzyme maturation, permease component [Paenibacillus sp. RU4T]
MSIILRMTWKELLRKRVLLLTLLMTVLFLIAFWFIASAIGGEVRRYGLSPDDPQLLVERYSRGMFIISLGFFFGAFVVAFLSIFSSSSVISGEAELGVMQALMPRPMPRWKWYVGRWLGYVSFGMSYALVLYAAILVVAGMHAGVPRDMGTLITAYLLFASVVPLLVSVSMLGSGYLSAIGNGVFMTMLYGGGWLGGMIDKMAAQFASLQETVGGSLSTISGLLSLAMPADGLQRTMMDRLFNVDSLAQFTGLQVDSIMMLFGVGSAPSPAFIWYALAYTIVAFGLGMWRFQRKDL